MSFKLTTFVWLVVWSHYLRTHAPLGIQSKWDHKHSLSRPGPWGLWPPFNLKHDPRALKRWGVFQNQKVNMTFQMEQQADLLEIRREICLSKKKKKKLDSCILVSLQQVSKIFQKTKCSFTRYLGILKCPK